MRNGREILTGVLEATVKSDYSAISDEPRARRRARILAAAVVCGIAGTANHAAAALVDNKTLTLDASIAAKEMFDSNIMLQSRGPDANKGGAITAITPAVGLTLKNPLSLSGNLRFDYAATIYRFHTLEEESHTDHQFGVKFSGTNDRWSYESSFSALMVVGEHESYRYFSADGIPALGTPGIRDRRSQLLLRANDKLQYTADSWFARPVLNFYSVDFHIMQSTKSHYVNYVDRSDMNGGVDLGIKLPQNLWGVVGYRFGYQDQGTVLTSHVYAANTYQRVLIGAEGSPFSWLKFNVLAGPDFRDFTNDAPAALQTDPRLYVEGSATATFSKDDELAMTAKRWILPSSCGKTVYADSNYELTYRHNFTSNLIGRVGMRVCGGEWEMPTHRFDWAYMPKATLEYKFNKHLSTEIGYEFDAARSADRTLAGRDYDRSLAWIGAKYEF